MSDGFSKWSPSYVLSARLITAVVKYIADRIAVVQFSISSAIEERAFIKRANTVFLNKIVAYDTV